MPVLTFGQRLREARLLAGYQRARHFAEALGIRENTYCRYERDEATPNYECLARICQLLNLDVGEVVLSSSPAKDSASVAHTISDSSDKSLDQTKVPRVNGDGRASSVDFAHTELRRTADPVSSTAICSLHAWRLSQLLVARTVPGGRDASEHLPMVTDYYFALKRDPYPTLMPFLSDPSSEKFSSDTELKLAIGRYLEAYHNHLKHLLSKD